MPISNMLSKDQRSECADSYIDSEDDSYYSRMFDSRMHSQCHIIEECCYFRKYIEADQLEQAHLMVRIDLYFKPQGEYVQLN